STHRSTPIGARPWRVSCAAFRRRPASRFSSSPSRTRCFQPQICSSGWRRPRAWGARAVSSSTSCPIDLVLRFLLARAELPQTPKTRKTRVSREKAPSTYWPPRMRSRRAKASRREGARASLHATENVSTEVFPRVNEFERRRTETRLGVRSTLANEERRQSREKSERAIGKENSSRRNGELRKAKQRKTEQRMNTERATQAESEKGKDEKKKMGKGE
ncbi:RecF/RecN/SMC N terminal domain-containing protein, partial [Toxoplasma gondii FOU]